MRRLSGAGVMMWLAGFFGLIVAMNIYFITVSVQTFRGEDEQKPYLQGVEYNDTLARRAAQHALGWQAIIEAARQKDGMVRIDLLLRQADGHPVSGLAADGELRHPADETRDRALQWSQISPGHYVALLSAVSPGSWDVMISSRDARVPFEASRRVWVQ